MSNTPMADFTDATVIAAEGRRVGFVTCRRCGAAVLLDGRDDADMLDLHRRWHRTIPIDPVGAFFGSLPTQ